MEPRPIRTSTALMRRLKRGAYLERHPWGTYHLWDENGGRYSIQVAEAAVREAISKGRLPAEPVTAGHTTGWTIPKEDTDGKDRRMD